MDAHRRNKGKKIGEKVQCMKRLCLALVCCLVFVPLIASPAMASVPSTWTVALTPSYCLSGDTVNITITNSGEMRYGFVDLVAANSTIMSNDFFQLNSLGSFSYNLTIPYYLPSGDYMVSVVSGGAYVAQAQLSVVLDQLIYQSTLNNITEQRLTVLNERLGNLNTLITQEIQIRQDSLALFEVAFIIVLIAAVFMAFQFRPYVKYRLTYATGNGRLIRTVRNIVHPEPRDRNGAF